MNVTPPDRSTPKFPDSTGKLLHRLSRVAKIPIYQKGKLLNEVPRNIFVSPALLRRFTCVEGCIACCCVRITVDFTPEEFLNFEWTEEVSTDAQDLFKTRVIEVNGKEYDIITYEQFKDPACKFLRPIRGKENVLGCAFYLYGGNDTQPLECAAAPQLLMSHRGPDTIITKRPFGRAWAFKVTPQCDFEPIFTRSDQVPEGTGAMLLKNEIALLRRYLHWAEYLDIPTYIPDVIKVLEELPDMIRKSPAVHTVQVPLNEH